MNIQISRRNFLASGAAVGLTVGFHVPFAGKASAQGALSTPEVNAWVVIKPDDTVEMRTVTKGTRIGPDVEVEQGLQPGETVVSDGQLRLAPGMRVQVRK